MGLPNQGLHYYTSYHPKGVYILSVYAYDVDELDELFNNNNKMIEVNLSCPNVNNNLLEQIDIYLDKINKIKDNKIVGVKLPPFLYQHDIKDISFLLIKYNIDFITCCNTIPNCLVIKDDKTTLYNDVGGMSYKPLSLSNVFQFYKLLKNKIDIIGCGGIQTGQDVYDYILCGATCVQIGAQILREGVECLQRIDKELQDIMILKNYKNINDFKGKIDLRSKL
jgi:dihydroorotate dehydrogenase (fumarate)